MASHNNHIKIHEHCKVAPPSSSPLSLPLTFFDLMFLKFHPAELIFFYTLPNSQSHPSFFFEKLVPKLKSSLSKTLQHFLPLAGKVIWPSESSKPIIQFNPNDDGVSLIIAQCEDDVVDFNKILEYNSPHEASLSRSFVPHLESTYSFASIISIQITLFPKNGFCIGISTHHGIVDGKSSTMFMKVWASISKSLKETQSLPFLEPFWNREVIKDPNDLESFYINTWNEASSFFNESNIVRSLKILSHAFPPNVNDSVRATFELTFQDLDKINKRVLSKWNIVEVEQEEEPKIESLKPTKLSTFVLTCAYVSVCIAKSFQECERDKKPKFSFNFSVDCRARLEPPIPENYFGNCICIHIVETEPEDFTKEDGLVIVAKKIYGKTKKMDKGVLDGIETLLLRFTDMDGEGIKLIGVSWSNRFGVYETDFGWGRPSKVEITSIDRGLTIGLTDNKDVKGGVEIGLVLDKNVMSVFQTIFHDGQCFD